MSQTLSKLAGKGLAPLLPHLKLSDEAAAAVQGCQSATEALDKLAGGGFLMEAARLLAHGLPRREAVWWTCMCAMSTEPPDLPEADRKARAAAEQWVRQPSDQNRIAAKQQADATALATPESWAALAVFFCGESITPEGQPTVAPKPHIAGRTLSGAVVLSAVRKDPARQVARLQRFIESGRNVAAGGAGRLSKEEA
ncbi:MAG TPA: hypothetical protein VMB34_26970 [Acetobacteraceae bacterium]|nr:hypothetical protein [Acetobacteraceae bacterium]